MKYITREQFDKVVKDKNEIKADDLVYVLEEKLGYAVSLEEKLQLTDEQRKRMTDFVFTNDDILSQLHEASKNPEYIEDDEEAYKIIREAKNVR